MSGPVRLLALPFEMLIALHLQHQACAVLDNVMMHLHVSKRSDAL